MTDFVSILDTAATSTVGAVTHQSTLYLLRHYDAIMEELRRRNVIRSSNNPVADLAEYLFSQAFGWRQAHKSEKDFDAIEPDRSTRYQIKGRRLTHHNPSRQLGAIRRLADRNFDQLAAVLFGSDFSVKRAALIPHAVVEEGSSYVKATNSWRFLLTDDIWEFEGVRDVTDVLAKELASLK